MKSPSHAERPWHLPKLLPLLLCMGLGFAIGLNVRDELPKPREMQDEKTRLASPVNSLQASPEHQSLTPPIAPLERLHALTSIADAARYFDLPAAILLIDKLDLGECTSARFLFKGLDRNRREVLLDAIADRWASLDPVDAFNNAQATREDNDWSNRIGYAAAAALIVKDPEVALERISSARNDDLREKAAEWVLPQLARTHGRRAAEYLSSNSRLTRFEHLYRMVAKEFSRTSPLEAIAWASSLSDNRNRDHLMEGVWLGWSEADPRGAAAAMETNTQGNLPPSALSAVVRNLSRSDIKAALTWIASIPDSSKRDEAYDSIDFDPSLLSRGDARELLLSLESGSTGKNIAARMAHHLAREDIQTALSWAESLPRDKGQDSAFASVIQYWTSSDPAAAARYISSQPERQDHSIELSRAVNGWSQISPADAMAFAQTLPEGLGRDSAIEGIIDSLSSDESVKALELFQKLKDPEVISRVAPDLVKSLIKSDQTAALHILSQIPEESQPIAYAHLVRDWATDQPQLAGDWINTLPPGDARDMAIGVYASVLAEKDAGLATKWANQIKDPIDRMNYLLPTFSQWIQEDKAAARNWVEQIAIPEGFRPYFDRLLKEEK